MNDRKRGYVMRGLCKIIGFYMIMLVITIMSLVCISDGVCQAKVKSDKCKTKKINLRVSETYKIRYKKNAKYITSKPKVASVHYSQVSRHVF